MFCGTVCVITNEKGKVLLFKRSPNKKLFSGMWAIVSAGPYKSAQDAKFHIKEEVFQETGLNVEKLQIKDVLKTKLGKDEWKIFPYLTSINSDQEIILNNEHTEYRWVNKNELKNYEFPSGMDSVIRFFSTPKT